jgi:hypothetical protein
VIGAAAAALLGLLGYQLTATGVAGVVLVRTILQLVSPSRLHALEHGLTQVVGGLVANLLFTPLWLLFFVPLGLATRRRKRMFEGEAAWRPCADEAPEHARWS